MGSTKFKNRLILTDKKEGDERREELLTNLFDNSTPFPEPLEHKDIDEEFERWVKEDLSVSFEGKNLPTVSLFTNQRFSEYMQNWQNVDDKKNILMNFKIITRENNPKTGTQQGQSKNIPGDRAYTMKRVLAKDKSGREYFIDYKMKQPYTLDFNYKVSIVTNKYELLNKFNHLINDKFKAITCYIHPNGHYIPMKLNDITDESEYKIDDRQFYSQSYNILVQAYIISKEDFIVEEVPKLRISMFNTFEDKAPYAEIEEYEASCRDFEKAVNDFYYKPVIIRTVLPNCQDCYTFHVDINFIVESIETENVRNFLVRINGKDIPFEEFSSGDFRIKDGDEIRFRKINRYKLLQDSSIILHGHNDLDVYDSKKDYSEFKEAITQFEDEIIIKD